MKLTAGLIGLISDTHGLVRPEALAALRGSKLIIHAGDVGKPEVIEALKSVAPIIAIRGNNDRGAWAKKIPDVVDLRINGIRLQVIHNVNDFKLEVAGGFKVVVSGHSHKPGVVAKDGVLFINPGSAGPRRFNLPISVAQLKIDGQKLRARIIPLKICVAGSS